MLRLVVVVCFQDERDVLGVLLDSVRAQERPPDLLVLVDDGSADGSGELAARWAANQDAPIRLLSRPRRPPSRDRLGAAMELVAFQSVVASELASDPWDVIVKLDADLLLPAGFLAALADAFAAEPALGMAGTHLAELTGPAGAPQRMSSRDEHVHGATKCYRRACWEQIEPLPPILGWDTIDELRARLEGWETRSLSLPGGDPIHLRPMGTRDGLLRAIHRWGVGAWGYGEDPLHVVLMAARRLRRPPVVAGAAAYLLGYLSAAARRAPRAERRVRAYLAADQRRRMLRRLRCR